MPIDGLFQTTMTMNDDNYDLTDED